MGDARSYSVGELAARAGVSVRTLHHYDEIGLLSPSGRTAAGYRQYDRADAERLYRILIYRELGFDLAGITAILDDPAVDALEHLQRQRTLLAERVGRLQRMLKGVEAMMSAKKTGYNLTPDEMREVFGTFDPTEHAAEAEQRWGDTDAFPESQRRAASYDKEQWLRISAESAAINEGLIEAMKAGAPATSEQAMALAEQHRQHISRWFYDCGHDVHRGLAEMYIADARFTATYEDQAKGLSRYVHDAIVANAERAAR
ncbi:MAG: MerR family transcriptional regulator [Longimicrobiales bacterium]